MAPGRLLPPRRPGHAVSVAQRHLPKVRARRRRGKPVILICTPEITELPEGMGNAANYIRAKGGGLGDISAALIQYLYKEERFELHVALPQYDTKIRDWAAISDHEIDLLGPLLVRKGVHLINDSAFSHLSDVYGDSATHPRVRRAEALQRYIINQLLDELRPDVVHCNDWMTGLIPAAARAKDLKSVVTLHNVFTEKDTPERVDQRGIDVRRFFQHLYFESFPEDTLANWKQNRIDFLATGIYAADFVNTVSPSFLEEVVAGDHEAVIPEPIRRAIREKHNAGVASGILNAPGDTVDPRYSRFIQRYGFDDVVEGKAANKRTFQQRIGLLPEPDAPLLLWPSRLYEQKGPELLAAIAKRLGRELGAQIAIVANGAPEVEDQYGSLAAMSNGKISMRRFAEDLSELGKAAADFVLMPSLYEPCGLPQMECPRFGTLPIVRLTGGLKDTVQELDLAAGTGNGFVFAEHAPAPFEDAVRRAVAFHRLPIDERRPVLQRVMKESFERYSLANTAQHYIRVYESLIAEE